MKKIFDELRGIGRGWVLIWLGFGLVFTSCLDDKKKCGDNYDIVDVPPLGELCVPKEVDTGTSNGTDGDTSSDAGDGGDTGDGELPAGMGDVCNSHDDCTAEADYCAQNPGDPGICTLQDCSLDPDDCPAGYYCMDLSIFLPTLPTICVPDDAEI